MLSMRRLRSVTHSLAHHAGSGLSFFYSQLGRACAEYGVEMVTIDLIAEGNNPPDFPMDRSLETAMLYLRLRLGRILSCEGSSLEEVTAARVSLIHPGIRHGEYWHDMARAEISLANGLNHECFTGWGKFTTNAKYHEFHGQYYLCQRMRSLLGSESVLYAPAGPPPEWVEIGPDAYWLEGTNRYQYGDKPEPLDKY